MTTDALLRQIEDHMMHDNPIASLTEERTLTHGAFDDNAILAQQIKDVLRASPHWSRALNYQQREALDNIVGKMVRIVNGDAYYADHWRDIAGYAMLPLTYPGDE